MNFSRIMSAVLGALEQHRPDTMRRATVRVSAYTSNADKEGCYSDVTVRLWVPLEKTARYDQPLLKTNHPGGPVVAVLNELTLRVRFPEDRQ